MKRIGLLSDTHNFLDEKIWHHFKDCDEVWHAGDIGNIEIANKLNDFKIFRAVYGNIDDKEIRSVYPETFLFSIEGFKILIIHICALPPKYNSQVKKIIKEESPNIIICGHSHILRVINDPDNKTLYINPGAAGNHGFHKIKTILKFDLNNGKIENMKAIELGKRGILN